MKKQQRGMTTVEAAIGAALMLIMLFGTIEVSRAIFVWNFVDEVTRRGARVAAVCPFNHPGVRRAAIFAPPGGPADTSPHVSALTTSDINVEYLDGSGTSETVFEDTRFVRVSTNGFQLPFLTFSALLWTVPSFKTILPSESLGYNPDKDTCECFGTPGTGTDGCDFVVFP